MAEPHPESWTIIFIADGGGTTMTSANALRLFCVFSFCLNAYGADPLELRLWPGKAPGTENWTVPESMTGRGGNRVATNVSDPTLTVYLPDAAQGQRRRHHRRAGRRPASAFSRHRRLQSGGMAQQQRHRGFRAEVSPSPTTTGRGRRRQGRPRGPGRAALAARRARKSPSSRETRIPRLTMPPSRKCSGWPSPMPNKPCG